MVETTELVYSDRAEGSKFDSSNLEPRTGIRNWTEYLFRLFFKETPIRSKSEMMSYLLVCPDDGDTRRRWIL